MVEEGVKLFVKYVCNWIPRLETEDQWAGAVTPLISTGLRLPMLRICSFDMRNQMQNNITKTRWRNRMRGGESKESS